MKRKAKWGSLAVTLLLAGDLINGTMTTGLATQRMPKSVVTVGQEKQIQPILPALSAQERHVRINKTNFLQYFNINGDASYDQQTGIVTLTKNEYYQSGNMTLKNKINNQQDFVLTGKLNIGDKSQRQGGADGIGIGFHSGATTAVGQSGGAMGIGGLPGGFGWKADTFWNYDTNQRDSWYYADPAKFQGATGTTEGNGYAFGSFMANDQRGYVRTYDEADAPARRIDEPQNNEFKDVRIEYEAQNHMMTVFYDGFMWKTNVSKFSHEQKALAFMISAATGSRDNLQQFQITQFDYEAYGIANTRFVDQDTGEELTPGKQYSGDLGTSKSLAADTQAVKQLLADRGYDYRSVAASLPAQFNADQQTVTFTKNPNTITYYFSRQSGQVITHYVDETTDKQIHKDVSQTGRIDDPYTTNALAIDGYALDVTKMPRNADGKFVKGVQEITYYYRPVKAQPVENGTVTTKYVDEATGALIATTEQQPGRVGDDYTTSAKTIDGYALDNQRFPTNASGKFIKGDQVVTYYYKQVKDQPIENGTVTTKFVDEATNQELAQSVTQAGRVNDPYTTSPISIDDYALDVDRLPQNAKGAYKTGNQTVIYYYQHRHEDPIENGTVTTKFVDEATGRELSTAVDQKGRVNDPYTTAAKAISGYALDEQKLPKNAMGKYVKGNQVVTYYYQAVNQPKLENGTVTTHFIDEATGKDLHKTVSQSGRVGDDYTTSAINIEGYALDEQKLPKNANGHFAKAVQTVTYYYHQVSPQKVADGQIEARFIDEATGQEIHQRVKQTGRLGDAYTTQALSIDGYRLDQAKLPTNQTGKFQKEPGLVTYYYQKVTPNPVNPQQPITPATTLPPHDGTTGNTGDTTSVTPAPMTPNQPTATKPATEKAGWLPATGEQRVAVGLVTGILAGIGGGLGLLWFRRRSH